MLSLDCGTRHSICYFWGTQDRGGGWTAKSGGSKLASTSMVRTLERLSLPIRVNSSRRRRGTDFARETFGKR